MGAGRDVGLAQWHAFAAGARGWAEPLDDVWESFEPDGYLQGAREDVMWDGSVYGIPLDTNAMVMVTNDDLLEQGGIAPDGIRTFEDLAAAARAVSAPRRFGFLASASSWTTYGFIRANGGEVVEADDAGPPRFTLDAPAVVDTFAFLHELVAEDHVLAPDRPNFARDARQLFLDGTTAMLFTGTWDVATLQRSDVTFRWSVHPVPRGTTDGGTVLGGSSLYVPEGSGQRDLAIAFARHLTSDEMALRLWEEEGRLPARTRLLEDPLGSSELYATVVRELPVASPMRLIAFPRADRVYEDLLPELLSGEADPAALLHQAQAAAEAS
jgi:multiple sugar transport system substrate-binding protein